MSWVEETLEALRIEVVRPARDRVWCLCPYHQNPTDPKAWATAFFVRLKGKRRDKDGKEYEAEGQHFCFTCGEGGSMRRLVRYVRDCTEEEALEFIKKRGGKRSGTKVEELSRKVTVVRVERGGRVRFRMPREVIFDPLSKWVSGAREYVEGRGITQEEVDLFGLGYAVDGNKLAGRIVIPWLGRGRVAGGYSARTFVGAEPKYTTPGPDENADRGIMFGEHLWPEETAKRKLVVVTEGALNGLAVRRVLPRAYLAGIGGSNNFDVEQAKKLSTFDEGLLLTDPDLAGEKAARDIGMMVGRYVRLRRVVLPPGKDALDAGPEILLRALERALRRRS